MRIHSGASPPPRPCEKWRAQCLTACICGRQALHAAVAGGFADVVAVLLSHGAPINGPLRAAHAPALTWSPLEVSLDRADVEVSKVLLLGGADYKRTDCEARVVRLFAGGAVAEVEQARLRFLMELSMLDLGQRVLLG